MLVIACCDLHLGGSVWKSESKYWPLRKSFFCHQLSTLDWGKCITAILGPPGPLGGSGGPWGGFGGVSQPHNYDYCSVTNLSPGMQCFGLKQLVPLCFWGFGSNGAHLSQEKAVSGPNRVCKKVDFSQKHHLQICSNRTKMAILGH